MAGLKHDLKKYKCVENMGALENYDIDSAIKKSPMQLLQHRPLTFCFEAKDQTNLLVLAKPSVPFGGEKPAYLLWYEQQSCLAAGSRIQETKSTILGVIGPARHPKKAAMSMNPIKENCYP